MHCKLSLQKNLNVLFLLSQEKKLKYSGVATNRLVSNVPVFRQEIRTNYNAVY